MKEYFILMFFIALADIITGLMCDLYYAKKSNYNCENCKNWRCLKAHCDKKREKLESEIK